MTLEEFTSKIGAVQIDIVKDNGVLIGEREHRKHHIKLYQLYAFYVEIFFRKEDGKVWKVGGFDHFVLLQPYLDQVDISSLLNSNP